jgi:hypothetical protein
LTQSKLRPILNVKYWNGRVLRMPYFLALIIKIVFGLWALSVATGKGRSGGWFWLAFFFPIIGVIVAYCLAEQVEQSEPVYRPYFGPTVQCPYYQNGRPTGLSPMNALQASASLPSPDLAEIPDDGKWITCQGCGERATTDYARIRKRCPRCDMPYTLDSVPEKTAKATGAPAPEQPGRACSACGQVNAPNSAFCMSCGTKLAAPWTCSQCAAPNPPAAKFCMQCGAKKEN